MKKTVISLLILTASALICAAAKPNIIVIYADDVGYGDLGCYGAEVIDTPNLDAMAANGIRFTANYATASTCTPSRSVASLSRYTTAPLPARCT